MVPSWWDGTDIRKTRGIEHLIRRRFRRLTFVGDDRRGGDQAAFALRVDAPRVELRKIAVDPSIPRDSPDPLGVRHVSAGPIGTLDFLHEELGEYRIVFGTSGHRWRERDFRGSRERFLQVVDADIEAIAEYVRQIGTAKRGLLLPYDPRETLGITNAQLVRREASSLTARGIPVYLVVGSSREADRRHREQFVLGQRLH